MSRLVFGISLAIASGCCGSAAHAICPSYVLYVCGTVNGQYKTYRNSCVATNSGATDISAGKCKLRFPLPKHQQ